MPRLDRLATKARELLSLCSVNAVPLTPRSLRQGRQRGLSLIELLVVIGIISIVSAVAIPKLTSGERDIDEAMQTLSANFRLARSRAVSSGFHQRINIISTSVYRVERMVLSGGNWIADPNTAPQTITLPARVVFTVGNGTFELDSRGQVVGANALVTRTLRDTATNRNVQIEIWPSGQIYSSGS